MSVSYCCLYLFHLILCRYSIVLLYLLNRVIEKKSSTKNLLADCRSICRSTDNCQVLPQTQTTSRLIVSRQTNDNRLTVGDMSVTCRYNTSTNLAVFSLFRFIQHPNWKKSFHHRSVSRWCLTGLLLSFLGHVYYVFSQQICYLGNCR